MTTRPAPLAAVLGVTFLGSITGGTFWAGIFFLTADRYGFSPARNLVLGGVMGVVYALTARQAGPLMRALEGRQRINPRGMLAGTLGFWGLAALGPLVSQQGELMIWATALAGAVASALTWPIVESYLTSGRHGPQMRAAIGWFNVTWTTAVAAPLLLMPVLARHDALWSLALCAIVNALAIVVVFALPARPIAHETAAAEAAVGPEYPWLMRSAMWLLPLSYVMSSTLSPILPHRLAALGTGTTPGSVVAAIWMIARFTTLLLMWRIGFWHGRWGTLVAAAVALTAGTSSILLAPTLPLLVAGLVLFGAGMGLTYYAALYYSLAVGHAAVDASGSFESLVGVGYTAGPLLGLVGHALAGATRAGPTTVAITCVVAALASAAAARPYFDARRRRAAR